MTWRPDSRRLLAVGLVFLVVLGSWLRFHQISRNSLWSDELFTMAVALYHPMTPDPGQPWYRPINVTEIADGDTFLTVKAGEQSPPLHDLLAKASVQLLGPTEFAARLPSALAACALLICCGWLAWRQRDAWARSVLCWTLLLLAFFPVLVIYAKDGRAYSLGVSLVGIGVLQGARRWRAGWRAWTPPRWCETVPLALACLTHYNATALVAMLVLPDLVMSWKTRSRAGWLRLLGMAVIVLPWMAINARTILFTARGGVGWGPHSGWEFAGLTVAGATAILHPAWLILCSVLLVGLAGYAIGKSESMGGSRLRQYWSPKATACSWLAGAIVLHVALAGKIAASAGMANPRYYIFMIPLAALALAIVLAELRHRWLKTACAVAVVVLAVPTIRVIWWMPYEEFRSMARYAVQDAGPQTPFVFPWQPNRNMYRIYLERMLGSDMRSRMIATSSPEDAPRVCERLAGESHVAVVAHASGRARVDEVYAACGARWPYRYVEKYHVTFAEHWYAQPPARLPAR